MNFLLIGKSDYHIMGAQSFVWWHMAFDYEEAPIGITLDGGAREHDYAGEGQKPTLEAILPPALRGIDASKVETRTDLVRELNRTLPLNEYNLPLYIYRPDLLDPQALLQTDRPSARQQLADMLANSITNLNYDLGYPTLGKDDTPFWGQLLWESNTAFETFLTYLELEGVRGLHSIQNVLPELASEWYHQNCWKYRAQAFDAFRVAHHARMREQRIFSVQDDHYKKGQKLFQKVFDHLNSKPIEDLEFDKGVNALEKLSKIVQSTLGMQASNKDPNPTTGTSVEVVMRKTAETQHIVRKTDQDGIDMESLLSDPAALERAQELIIRVSR